MNALVIALTLLWTPAQDAEGYRIYTIDSVGAPWSLLVEIPSPTPNPEGLIEYNTPDPDVLTLYQVRAYNASGETAMEHSLVGHDPDTQDTAPSWPPSPKVGTTR